MTHTVSRAPSPALPRSFPRRPGADGKPTESTSPLVGTPVPAVTSTCSAPSTWLTEVPRTWRTASAMPFMPWM